MKSATAAPLLAALVVAVLSAAPSPSAAVETRPTQPLQPPVENDQLRAPDDSQRQTPRRVAAPVKPPGNTQVIPGVTFLHKEGSTEAVLRARERAPGAEPTLPDGQPIADPVTVEDPQQRQQQ